jgi:ribosomal protein S24E
MSKLKVVLLAFVMGLCSIAQADYRFIVPQEPGNGTDIWARIVAREMSKKLGETIIVENIPGANDIPGFNKFHNTLRKDPKVVMVAHGGNAESFLYQKVDYNYADYDPIGLQNLTIMVGRRTDSDVYKMTTFPAASGTNPDIIAMTLLVCGPGKTMQEYAVCYKQHFKYVMGMSGNERKLAYIRGEVNSIRETPSAYFKNIAHIKENQDWFNPGVLDINTGKVVADTNFPGVDFIDVYKKKWGVAPSGDLYNSWLLVKNYRDVLQKALYVDKGNPNRDKLRKALADTLADPVSVAAIEKETGKYPWVIGNDIYKAHAALEKLTTKKALKDLVWWVSTVLGQESIYKDNIAKVAH